MDDAWKLRVELQKELIVFIDKWLAEHPEAKLTEEDIIKILDPVRREYANRYDKERKQRGVNKHGEYY